MNFRFRSEKQTRNLKTTIVFIFWMWKSQCMSQAACLSSLRQNTLFSVSAQWHNHHLSSQRSSAAFSNDIPPSGCLMKTKALVESGLLPGRNYTHGLVTVWKQEGGEAGMIQGSERGSREGVVRGMNSDWHSAQRQLNDLWSVNFVSINQGVLSFAFRLSFLFSSSHLFWLFLNFMNRKRTVIFTPFPAPDLDANSFSFSFFFYLLFDKSRVFPLLFSRYNISHYYSCCVVALFLMQLVLQWHWKLNKIFYKMCAMLLFGRTVINRL